MADDPTVNRLQDFAADLFGYPAAMFAPSGTQTNLIALMTHCGRGDEYLVGQEAHTYKYEGGGAAVLGSIQPQPIANQPDGSIALADIEAYIKPDDMHFARTRLLALENTIGGRVLGQDYIAAATTLAHAKGLATHLDGARICNAAVKQGISLRDAVKGFDTVSVCLSKGLGAPVGSVLLGPKAFIEQGIRWRKMLGGGMRQAGVLAAAAHHALEHNVQRLAEDHENAAAAGARPGRDRCAHRRHAADQHLLDGHPGCRLRAAARSAGGAGHPRLDRPAHAPGDPPRHFPRRRRHTSSPPSTPSSRTGKRA